VLSALPLPLLLSTGSRARISLSDWIVLRLMLLRCLLSLLFVRFVLVMVALLTFGSPACSPPRSRAPPATLCPFCPTPPACFGSPAACQALYGIWRLSRSWPERGLMHFTMPLPLASQIWRAKAHESIFVNTLCHGDVFLAHPRLS
jgi:hypothetical protein